MIRFRMEQAGLTVKDMEPYIGRSNRVYGILSGKRSLTLPRIRRLNKGLELRRNFNGPNFAHLKKLIFNVHQKWRAFHFSSA